MLRSPNEQEHGVQGGSLSVREVDLGHALGFRPVFDEPNFLRPQVTELAFNFDGTVRSGAGDPRQMQLGVRVLF